ncbi:MAG TPA: UDP-N-acetylmuramyl peptide synthase, partial [Firmicutes bacterium]|nr:UDP-N-acetylmuramyl peptide synthase [Bacillota bacterium]
MEILEPLSGVNTNRLVGDLEITSLAYHSDQVLPGSLFFCVVGYRRDGHSYAAEAVFKGAVAV